MPASNDEAVIAAERGMPLSGGSEGLTRIVGRVAVIPVVLRFWRLILSTRFDRQGLLGET